MGVKISQLPSSTSPSGSELAPIVQSGKTVNFPLSALDQPIISVSNSTTRKSLSSYNTTFLRNGLTKVEQTDDPDNLWLYAGGDISQDSSWRGMPKLDSSGNILAGGVQIRELTTAQAVSDVPADQEIVSIEGQMVVGDGATVAQGLTAPLMHPTTAAASNTQTSSKSLQIGGNNTQSGYYNFQSGTSNTQSGYRSLQSGQSLNDGGFDNVTMIGFSKTAAVGNVAYFWVENGIRIKPVASDPSTLEDGTIWITTGGDLKFRANGVTKTTTAT